MHFFFLSMATNVGRPLGTQLVLSLALHAYCMLNGVVWIYRVEGLAPSPGEDSGDADKHFLRSKCGQLIVQS